jgi:hypothetical protein
MSGMACFSLFHAANMLASKSGFERYRVSTVPAAIGRECRSWFASVLRWKDG